MANLIVLSEDVTGVERYFSKNGLYPTRILYKTNELVELLAYANSDMQILIVIHGFTRFTTTEVNVLFRELRQAQKQGADVAILTDIYMLNPDLRGMQYIHYEGDLFFGKYTWYNGRKKLYDTTEEDAKIADILNDRKKDDGTIQNCRRQKFWDKYSEFATPPKRMIFGEKPETRESKLVDSDSAYVSQLVSIDLGIPLSHTLDIGDTVSTNNNDDEE